MHKRPIRLPADDSLGKAQMHGLVPLVDARSRQRGSVFSVIQLAKTNGLRDCALNALCESRPSKHSAAQEREAGTGSGRSVLELLCLATGALQITTDVLILSCNMKKQFLPAIFKVDGKICFIVELHLDLLFALPTK